MAYEIYYNKQPQPNLAESPDTTQGFSQNNMLSRDTVVRGIGIGTAAAVVLPQVSKGFNTTLQATGNSRLKRRINNLKVASQFGYMAYSLGALPALGVAAAAYAGREIVDDIQNYQDNVNQNYEVRKRGVRINKFVGTGERYD